MRRSSPLLGLFFFAVSGLTTEAAKAPKVTTAGRFVADQIAPEARGRSLLAAAEPQPGDQTNQERFL
jgi:hypothetical protein